MAKGKKLSTSKASGKHFAVKSKPISKSMEKRLSEASAAANIKISRNNQIYSTSNSHASYYATK
ncbi:MAG: hypothetical protein HDQ97_16270 [Lachnospiraceae bacterium]|nr:hypothetical protein [Lachnospiraceae bacterium]